MIADQGPGSRYGRRAAGTSTGPGAASDSESLSRTRDRTVRSDGHRVRSDHAGHSVYRPITIPWHFLIENC
eukprot:677424-Hanusia_phi.AAC.1